MSYTLDSLKQAIQDYTETTETTFVNNLDNFIVATENRIWEFIKDLVTFKKNATSTLTTSNAYLAKPADFLMSNSLSVTVSGSKQFLIEKDVNFLQDYNPDGSSGVPRYYAEFDTDNFLLAPTPDDAYGVELHYAYIPASLTVGAGSGTTWISENYPNDLLYGCLEEAAIFLKYDAADLNTYRQRFMEHVGLLKLFAESREQTDSYRTDTPRSPKA